jgi:hypothetical protein
MAFQPFGYRFDLAIRAKRKGWFASKTGARGWMIGPLLCLWWDPYDKQGPMLIGWLSEDGFGTRIIGRAGSDLNGMLLFVVIYPFLAWIFFQMARNGGMTLGHGSSWAA